MSGLCVAGLSFAARNISQKRTPVRFEGAIIVEEAGGVCVDTLGGPFDLASRRMLVSKT